MAVTIALFTGSIYEAHTATESSMEYFYAADGQTPPADWQELVKYLLSFATGLIAVFLRALIKRIWPNFEFDEKKPKY